MKKKYTVVKSKKNRAFLIMAFSPVFVPGTMKKYNNISLM